MKKYFLLMLMTGAVMLNLQAQVAKTMVWDGTEREYLEYVPTGYDGLEPMALLLVLHGLGDDMNNMFAATQFKSIADAHNWLVITPQALPATVPMLGEIGTCWNAGITASVPFLGTISLNADVDDVGFLSALMDSAFANYNINPFNVFCTGFSMGGLMTNRMGIEKGWRFNAIASVSGTIGTDMLDETPDCSWLNTMHIHGTADSMVSYANGEIAYGGMSVVIGAGAEATVDYWRNFNQCAETPEVTEYEDAVADGLTFTQYLYKNANTGAKTAFIKNEGGEHTWYYTPDYDIDYTTEIYKFFASCMIANAVAEQEAVQVAVYPNPTADVVTVQIEGQNNLTNSTLRLFDAFGRLLMEKRGLEPTTQLDLSELAAGIYLVQCYKDNQLIENVKVIKK